MDTKLLYDAYYIKDKNNFDIVYKKFYIFNINLFDTIKNLEIDVNIL